MSNRLKEVGERIRQARKTAGINQEKLAELLDISTSYVSDIENGKTNIGLEIFMRITEVLQVSADWLLMTDTPTVSIIHNNEISSLISSCSKEEIKAIKNIIKELNTLTKSIKKD